MQTQDGQLTVGIQPASLAMDRNNKLWTVTDGGYEGTQGFGGGPKWTRTTDLTIISRAL